MEDTPTLQDLRDYYNAKVSPHLTPNVEKMIDFIGYIDDFMNPPDVLKQRISDMADNPLSVDWMFDSLNAFEETLTHPPTEKGVLAAIVSFDANQSLEDPTSDEEAIVILRNIAELIRRALSEKAPPTDEERIALLNTTAQRIRDASGNKA